MPLRDRLQVFGLGGACIAAGLPSTTVIPLPLTLALTRRFRREELLKRVHLMVSWARFCHRRLLQISLDLKGQHHLPSPSRVQRRWRIHACSPSTIRAFHWLVMSSTTT